MNEMKNKLNLAIEPLVPVVSTTAKVHAKILSTIIFSQPIPPVVVGYLLDIYWKDKQL